MAVIANTATMWTSSDLFHTSFKHRDHRSLTELRRKNREVTERVEQLETSVKHAREEMGRAIQSEQRALEAREEAMRANRAKSVFLANMAHELRSPLNAILGFAQLLQRSVDRCPEDRESLGVILSSGNHLLSLINDVLSLSKIEAGRVTLNEQVFEVRRTLQGLEEMFRVRARAKALTVAFEPGPGLPETVRGDEGKLRQILINLLENAMKFTERGSITLRASWREGLARFEVEDTGPGIPETEHETILEPFQQTDSGLRSGQGSGLGLSISRGFIRMMGGDIRIRSELGRGTTFSFEIPLPAAEGSVRHSESRRVIGLEPNQRTFRILVADDQEETRILMARMLEPLGFRVLGAADGAEALRIWRTWAPHLVWMDMRMPRLDGYEATRRIRSSERRSDPGAVVPLTGRPRCAIIALTASAFEHDQAAIRAAGCDDFVSKPFQFHAILDKLVRHLGVRFRYEDSETSQSATAGLTMERLQSLPAEWVENLSLASALGDDLAAHRVVDRISQRDAPLGLELRKIVKRFQFEELAGLLKEVQNDRCQCVAC